MESQSSGKKVSGSAEFTEHAEAQLKLDHRNSLFDKYDAARDGPQLVDVNSKTYEKCSNLIHQTYAECDISKIRQVYAPEMYGMYLLRKEEMRLEEGGNKIQESLLYHVTNESRALESLQKSGLDWRLTWRFQKTSVLFSDDADYANYICGYTNYNRIPEKETRVIMICTLLVRETNGIPIEDFESTYGRANATMMSDGNRVYEKFNDYEFYPLYFVYFTNSLRYMVNSKYFHASARRDIEYCKGRTLEQMCIDRNNRR